MSTKYKTEVTVVCHDELCGLFDQSNQFSVLVEFDGHNNPDPVKVVKRWLIEVCDYDEDLDVSDFVKYHYYNHGDGVIVFTSDRGHLAVLLLNW